MSHDYYRVFRKSALGRYLEKRQIGKIRREPNNRPGCYNAAAGVAKNFPFGLLLHHYCIVKLSVLICLAVLSFTNRLPTTGVR